LRDDAVLRLQRRRDASGRRWWQAAGISVTDPRHIKQFADTIGTFGTAKQRREPGRKRLAATS
jgi:hypothetical protein